jgi:CopG family transcriptional regulator/antitoxin EndoAI
LRRRFDLRARAAYIEEAMKRASTKISITLPQDTLHLIDRVAEKKDRSRFIDAAVKYYVEAMGRMNIRKQIKEGSIRRAERDIEMAEEWFSIDEETGNRK